MNPSKQKTLGVRLVVEGPLTLCDGVVAQISPKKG
jgi:hypothetical protein